MKKMIVLFRSVGLDYLFFIFDNIVENYGFFICFLVLEVDGLWKGFYLEVVLFFYYFYSIN